MQRIVVLASGNGSNFQVIVEHIRQQNLAAEVVALIANKADAFALTRAKQLGIQAICHPSADYLGDRQAYDNKLCDLLTSLQPDLIILAGYMRIMSASLVEAFYPKIINIHPSLLPKYKGLDTHQRALTAGEKEHGASVHFVTPGLDEGPVILQQSTPILPDMQVEDLQQAVHKIEYQIYPKAISALINGQVTLQGDQVIWQTSA